MLFQISNANFQRIYQKIYGIIVAVQIKISRLFYRDRYPHSNLSDALHSRAFIAASMLEAVRLLECVIMFEVMFFWSFIGKMQDVHGTLISLGHVYIEIMGVQG